MSDAARKAARGLNRDFGELGELQVAKKAPADFVSAADLKAEQTIFEALAKARPGYGFLGEERGMIEGTDKTHTWIVDPLDGTTNFLHAIPHRSEEHTSELQSLMRISYAVFCLKKKKKKH